MLISNVQNIQSTYIDKDDANKISDSSFTKAQTTYAANFDTFEKQETYDLNNTYKPVSKLSSDQIDELNRQRQQSTIELFSQLVNQNVSTQANLAGITQSGIQFSTQSADLLTSIFGSMENALPTPATTPEGALASISEGGAYSIEAVSERIMLMATTLAGGDAQKLEEMQAAVVKGFEAAGLNTQTGEGMPDITMDTYNHVMDEFAKLKSDNVTEQA